MSAQPLSESMDARRRHEIGLIARALRRHLQWQAHLGADGAPRPQADELAELAARIEAAQRRKDDAARRALLGEPEPAPPQARGADPRQRPSSALAAEPASQETASARPSGVYKTSALLSTSASDLQASARDVRQEGALSQIRQRLGDCRRCRLADSRSNIVFGDGNPEAELLFIGDAPGFHEDRHGAPFVGRDGQLLDRMIQAMGLRRDEVYLCNIIKCRTPGGRAPAPEEIDTCRPFLIDQLKGVSPKVIVSLGEIASQTLLRDNSPIKRLRGTWHQRAGIRIMPTYHPAHLLKNPDDKRVVWDDLKQVLTALGR